MGGGSAGMVKHTHTHTHTHTHCPRDTQGRWSLGHGSDAILTHVIVAAPLIKLMGKNHRLDTVGSGGTKQGQHTHSVHRDTQGGWSHEQGSNTILTHVGVAPH